MKGRALVAQSTLISPNHYPGRTSPINQVVIHTMESPENPTTAEAVANYFQRTSVQASANVCVDSDSCVLTVHEKDTAWACPGFNASGYQIELAGYARQSAADWADDYSDAELHIAAEIAAGVATRNNIPVRHLTVAQVRAGEKGFMGHHDATLAGVGGNTHTDPGDNFPWAKFLQLVLQYQGKTGGTGSGAPVTPVKPKPRPTPKPAPAKGKIAEDGIFGVASTRAGQRALDTPVDGVISDQPRVNKINLPALTTARFVAHASGGSTFVRALQRWAGAGVDGFWGANTTRAIQRKLGVKADGIFGPATAKALQHAINSGRL